VQSGGTLAPGISAQGTLTNTIGTLTVNGSSASGAAVSLAGGAQLSFKLNGGGQSDLVALTNGMANDISFSHNTIAFTDLSHGLLDNGAYTLFHADAAN